MKQLISATQSQALAKGDTPSSTAALELAYKTYASKLAKTLSRLSQEEQDYVFYGAR